MIRIALLFSLLAMPAVAQTAVVDPTEERPGRWVSVPRATEPAPVLVMEAPSAAPLIPTQRAPSVVMVAPEAAPVIEPPRAAPETRPTPRPRFEEVVQASEIAQQVAAAPAAPRPSVAPVAVAPTGEATVTREPAPLASPDADAAPDLLIEQAEHALVEPVVDARQITVADPPEAPQSVPRLDAEAMAAIEGMLQELAYDAARSRAPTPILSLRATALHSASVPASSVRLPQIARSTVPVVPPRGAIMPTRERAPILPRLSPSGPVASDQISGFGVALPTRLSAVLLPNPAPAPIRVPAVGQAALPGPDLFPYSALPPSTLPDGPDVLTHTPVPRLPVTQANAAVLVTGRSVIPLRVRAPLPSVMPAPGEAPLDPNRAIVLPVPDAMAVARMMEDAQICWRLADISVEAQWAEIAIDVALDEWNMPAASSITFTGFAHVVSGAAEDAFRAAHAALMGCAMASENTPATSATTLLFDRNGVHLR